MRAIYTIDLERERLVGRQSPEIARLFDGKSPSPAAFSGWVNQGVRGIKLPSVLVGGRRLTSPDAIVWWIQATNSEVTVAPVDAELQAAAQRDQQVDAAIAMLESPPPRAPHRAGHTTAAT